MVYLLGAVGDKESHHVVQRVWKLFEDSYQVVLIGRIQLCSSFYFANFARKRPVKLLFVILNFIYLLLDNF